MRVWVFLTVAALPTFSSVACKVYDPLYCDVNHPCRDPARTFCDLEGAYPASDGIRRTCIPNPGSIEPTDSGIDAAASEIDSGLHPDGGGSCADRLAFVSERDGDAEIYVTGADGVDQRNLTQSPTRDRNPEWSPDGSRIVFVRDSEIWLIEADGAGLRQLTDPPAGYSDVDPQWSPDGARLAFKRTAGEGEADIWVTDATGSEPTRLTEDPDSVLPSWSPDGTTIAFASNRDGDHDVYTMNADGTGEVNLTNNAAEDGTCCNRVLWSPDGATLYFISDRDGNPDVWAMTSSGRQPRNLTSSPVIERQPVLVPDGSVLVFAARSTDGLDDIYSMGSDGSAQTNLTQDPTDEDGDPQVSVDGTHLVWTKTRDDVIDVYVGDRSGGGRALLTDDTPGVLDYSPAWQPCVAGGSP